MDREQAIETRLIVEQARKELLDRYALLNASMRAAFHRGLFEGSLPNPRAQNMVDHELRRYGNAASQNERDLAKITSARVMLKSGADVDSEDVARRSERFSDVLSRQISNDAKAVSNLFHKTQLRLQSNVVPRDETYSQALEAINSDKMFLYVDAKRRQWASKHFVRVFSNDYYYGLVNDFSIGIAVAQGRKTVVLDRPGHETDGAILRVANIDKEKQKYLHPGSQGIVVL